MIKKITMLTLVTIALTFIACSKDKKDAPTSQKKGFLKQALTSYTPQLTEKIPANAIAFYSLSADKDNQAFVNFQNSPYAQQSSSIKKMLSQSAFTADDTDNSLLTIMDRVSKSILNPWINRSSKTSEALALATKDDQNEVNFALYFYSKDKQYFANNFAQLDKDLTDMKLISQPAPAELKGEKKLSYKIPASDLTVFITSSKNHLAVSTSTSLANQVFETPQKANKFDFNSEEYKRLRAKAPSRDEFGVFYCDVQQIVQLIPELGSIDAQYKPLLNLIPRQIFANVRMTDKMQQDFLMYVPKSEFPEELKAMFDHPAANPWGSFSDKSFLAFNLNLNFLTRALTYLTKLSPDKELKEFLQFLPDSLEQQSSISMALNNTNITGYPDAQLVLSAPESSMLITKAKTLFNKQSAGSALDQMQWQKKEIAGVTADFMASPFGVGLYMGEADGKVLLASSESSFSGLIQPQQTLRKVVEQKLEKTSNTAIFSSYIDYTEIYKIIMNFRNMLNMFIPPDSKQEANVFFEQIESLKKMGSIHVNSSYNNDVLGFNMISKPIMAAAPTGQPTS